MNNKPIYLCDPEKNVNCPKDICQSLGRGECIYTSDPRFAINLDMRIENNESFKKKQTNQDKIAELVRTADHEILAKMIFEGQFEPLILCGEDCPAYEYCNSRMKYDEEDEPIPDTDGSDVTCEVVMNEWLIKEV